MIRRSGPSLHYQGRPSWTDGTIFHGTKQRYFLRYTSRVLCISIQDICFLYSFTTLHHPSLRYCERFSDGTHDPVFHETFFLEQALDEVEKYAAQDREHSELVARVKDRQRDSAAWRTRWTDYCEMHGDGVRDPALKDSHFIRRALRELVTTADHTAPTRPFLAITGENHSALVNEVKALQRNSPGWQELWIERCEKRSDGTCDPSHHDTGFLRLAIREIGHSTWKCQTQTDQRGQEIQLLCEARRKSQRAKAFPRADELRKMLWSMGVDVDDKKKTWKSDDGLSGSFQDPEEAHAGLNRAG